MSANHLPAATGWVPTRDGTAVVYLVKGRGRAVALLSSTAATAEPAGIGALFDYLVDTHHHVVLVNQRNGSGWGENPAADARDLLSILHRTGPATVVAHAHGARAAIAAALADPQAIRHLALYEPAQPPDGSADLRVPLLLMVGHASPADRTAGAAELAALCPTSFLLTVPVDPADPFAVPATVGQVLRDFLEHHRSSAP